MFAWYLAAAKRTEWVVYAKEPFGGPQQVLAYLGRYTHRVAISNNRLVDIADEHVTFHWKDYRHESTRRVMRLKASEFIRRFLLHVLPHGLQRIRHYGLLSNRCRKTRLGDCRRLLKVVSPPEPATNQPVPDYRDRYASLTGRSLRDCPVCACGHMLCIEVLPIHARSRGPPAGGG